MATVSVDRVSKSFGTRRVLDGVSLEIPDGSIFGLIGPNGAGKTTLLSILAGLRKPDDGRVAIDGHPPGEVRLGFMPDTPQDYPWLTVEESLRLAARICGASDVDSVVAESIDKFGLSAFAKARQRSLSRGMRQRAALAAALVGSPEVVVLDEPCSALDPLGRADVLSAVAALRGTATVIFSTHLLADVERVCDRVAVIFGGRIVADDSIESFRSAAASRGFVIVFDRPVPGLISSFARESWCVSASEPAPGRIELEVADAYAAQNGILELLRGVQAELISLERAGTSLERALLSALEKN